MKKLALALCLVLSGCAQYSACVKAQMGPTLKALTAQQVETQVSDILKTAASAQWVAVGLQAAEDACVDINCKALVSCAAQAWAQAHPAKPVLDGVKLYKTKFSMVKSASLQCASRVASL